MKGALAYIITTFLLTVLWIPHARGALTGESTQELPYKLSDVDHPPRIISKTDPLYPVEAKRGNMEGKVTLHFIVTKQGEVKAASVMKSVPPGVFDENALAAIRKWRFTPATKNGEAVDVIIIAPLKFELQGGGPSSYDWYVAVEQGLTKLKSGNYKEAIEEYTTAINYARRFPGNSVSYNHRGLAYWKLGNNRKAISDFKKAIALDPEQVVSYTNRGRAYVTLKEYQKAIDDYSAAIDLDPGNAAAYASRANVYWVLENLQAAADDCSTALRLSPELTATYYVRGNVYRELGRYQNAIIDYSQVIHRNPEYTKAYNYQGYAYNKLDKIDESCADFEKACELQDCRGLELLKRQGGCREKVSQPQDEEDSDVSAAPEPSGEVAEEQGYEIRLSRPTKVGQIYELTASASLSEEKTASLSGEVLKADKFLLKTELQGTVTVLGVDELERATKVRLRVSKCLSSMHESSNLVEALTPGTLIIAQLRSDRQEYTIDGNVVSEDIDRMLGQFISLIFPKSQTTDDDIFGAKERKKVGDVWAMSDPKAARALLGNDVDIAVSAITGSTIIEDEVEVDGTECLRINTRIIVKDFSLPFPPGVAVENSVVSFVSSGEFPVDTSIGPLSVDVRMVMQVSGKGRPSPSAPEAEFAVRIKRSVQEEYRFLN